MNSEKKLNKVINNSLEIGNKAYKRYKITNKYKQAWLAIHAYKCALKAEIIKANNK